MHRTSNASRSRLGSSALDPAFVTLAERFAGAGYRTAAFTDGVVLSEDWNLLQGFEVVDAETTGGAVKLDRVLAFLDERAEYLLYT